MEVLEWMGRKGSWIGIMTRSRRVKSEGQLHQQQQRHNPQTVQGLVFVAAVTNSGHKLKKCPSTYEMQVGCGG